MSITPLRQQYINIKQRYPDTILFFRLGDFYETFDDDARITARELEITLTSREMEILKWASQGMSNKELSEKLGISLRTVKAHMTNIFNKLGCSSRTDAIIKGLKQGYIDLDDIQ